MAMQIKLIVVVVLEDAVRFLSYYFALWPRGWNIMEVAVNRLSHLSALCPPE